MTLIMGLKRTLVHKYVRESYVLLVFPPQRYGTPMALVLGRSIRDGATWDGATCDGPTLNSLPKLASAIGEVLGLPLVISQVVMSRHGS
jgi:hypothetical protein